MNVSTYCAACKTKAECDASRACRLESVQQCACDLTIFDPGTDPDCPVHAAPSSPGDKEQPFEPDDKLRAEVAKAIDEYPLIASLLYDIDLLPEQIKDERRYNYMLAVIDHMRHALRSATPASDVVESARYWSLYANSVKDNLEYRQAFERFRDEILRLADSTSAKEQQ